MTSIQAKDTAISLDMTAGENVKKVRQETEMSLVTPERNYGVYLDKAVQGEVQRNSPQTRKALQNKSLSKRPRRDLNPCCRRERPMSWARLDDGDANGEPCWIRTSDPLLKRQMLYRLS